MTTDLKIGNAIELIHTLGDKSVDCVMTSPPYYGLRNYQTPPVIFDGNKECEHEWEDNTYVRNNDKTADEKQNTNIGSVGRDIPIENAFCTKCNAWMGQLGLEPSPELFIKHLVNFFDDVKLKLKDEGNLFVNLGDTYWGGKGKSGYELPHEAEIRRKNNETLQNTHNVPGYLNMRPNDGKHEVIKPKSLCLIPERFAWGMIEHGWILRNKITWHKLNHMPESVTDRFTKSHEFIYHFVKQKNYYYNLDSIREPHKTQENRPMGIIRSRTFGYQGKYEGNKMHEDFGSPRARTQRKNDNTGYGTDGKGIQNHSGNSLNHPLGKNPGDFIETTINSLTEYELRNELKNFINQWQKMHPEDWNPIDVFELSTQPYPMAHFATFPVKLIEKPILAGCPPGGTVLDPFGGSGTVAEFCRVNNRNAIIFELNPDYKPQIVKRAHLDEIPLTKFFRQQ